MSSGGEQQGQYDAIADGERSIANMFGARVLPELDLSSLPDSVQALFGGDMDPQDPEVQREVIAFIQSQEGAQARRLIEAFVGEEQLLDMLTTPQDVLDTLPSLDAQGKLMGTLEDLTSGKGKKVIKKNVETIQFGKVKTIRKTTPQIGRNDACPCGSGKKFKNCCRNKANGTN